MELIFDWDVAKDRKNIRKHKITFEEAKTIFHDAYLITYPDEVHSDNEDRYISIGYSTHSRILLAIHTEHQETDDNTVIRIISCRKATPAERRYYEE